MQTNGYEQNPTPLHTLHVYDIELKTICDSHQLLKQLLQILVALVDVGLGATQRHDVALTMRVGERDLHLVEAFADLADAHALLTDHGAVEPLLDDDVATLLILLSRQKRATD